MIQIVYTSIAAEDLGSGDVFKIVEKSAKNNQTSELTGFLIYTKGRFFQVVEGPFGRIDDLLDKLQDDSRHHSIQIVHRANITARSFPNWRMKRIMIDDEANKVESLIPELNEVPRPIKRAAEDFLNLSMA